MGETIKDNNFKNSENKKNIKVCRRGYDVISNCFFVEEIIKNISTLGYKYESSKITSFDNLDDYYNYLNGKIYKNACYFQYKFSNVEIKTYKIRKSKINFTSLIDYNIDNYIFDYPEGSHIYNIKKYYDYNGKFVVEQTRCNKDGKLKTDTIKFDFFFDFLFFLKNDLSGADLSFCEGYKNILDFSGINTNGIKLSVMGKTIENCDIASQQTFVDNYFEIIKCNEEETDDFYVANREALPFCENYKFQKIYYITDIHLVDKLKEERCFSPLEIKNYIQGLIYKLLDIKECESILLIGGDISSDFFIFSLFVRMLRKTLDERFRSLRVVFVLGNHEFWGFGGYTVDEIVARYQEVITENKMYFLQNNILYGKQRGRLGSISIDELNHINDCELWERLKYSCVIFLGGVGFSQYNEKFNADNGIYQNVIDRKRELEEGKKFELLYKRICYVLGDRRIIVFTHMPLEDWSSDREPHKGFIYVNGHTHRNLFYDDGDYRLYADNQIGYSQKNIALKYFYLNDDYDIFGNFTDGTYEISRDDYLAFYRGKNFSACEFTREFVKLYMLKKKHYYCFILELPSGTLSILNGGCIKGLSCRDINYYYNKMDLVIEYIKTPLDKFTSFQERISSEIRLIGGSGRIHGAIVDIDYYNHVYVNPIDLKITPYWASDVVNKVAYPNLSAIIEAECPLLYQNYNRIIANKPDSLVNINNMKNYNEIEEPTLYHETDIYRASKEILKMQKLNSNVLTTWIEPKSKKIQNKN